MNDYYELLEKAIDNGECENFDDLIISVSYNDLAENRPILLEKMGNLGTIYMIENTENDKKYIGKTWMLVKNGNNGIQVNYGDTRLEVHKRNSRYRNLWVKGAPFLAEAMFEIGEQNFYSKTLKICKKSELISEEKKYIKMFNTSCPKFGYNKFVGVGKPDDPELLRIYKENKAASNKARAVGGKLKKDKKSKVLPPNIYPYGKGFCVKICLGPGNMKYETFTEKTEEENLDLAIKQLKIFNEEIEMEEKIKNEKRIQEEKQKEEKKISEENLEKEIKNIEKKIQKNLKISKKSCDFKIFQNFEDL